MNVKPIERIENPSVEEFQQNFVIPNKPVIISGIAKHWPACSLWKPETFKTMFGRVQAPLRKSDNELDVFFGEAKQKTTMSIAEYIDLIYSIPPNGKRPPYLGNISFNDPLAKSHLDQISSHLKFPDYFPVNSGHELRLWVGATGQKSAIHNDNYHNLNVQIFGKKSFLLFSPEQHERLYPVKIHDGLWSSPIDPQKPDLEKFPLFRQAEALEGTLDEGDLIFIPAFWWHQALAITICINVNKWVFTYDISEFWSKEHPSFSKKI